MQYSIQGINCEDMVCKDLKLTNKTGAANVRRRWDLSPSMVKVGAELAFNVVAGDRIVG